MWGRIASARSSSPLSSPKALNDDNYLSSSAMIDERASLNTPTTAPANAPVASNTLHSSATPTLESQDQQLQAKELLPVRIRFKRVEILLSTGALVVVTVALMLLCANDGLLIDTFESKDKTLDQRKTLLDDYNSYSGMAVGLITKPLDTYLAMLLAVGFLCFATKFTTASDASSGQRYSNVFLVVTGVCGYLLTTGFNAINVQLTPRPIEAVITPNDLSFSLAEENYRTTTKPVVEYTGPARVAFMKPSDKSTLEENPDNKITNTIMRTAVVPMEFTADSQCRNGTVSASSDARRTGAVISYGFPSRAWNTRVAKSAANVDQSLQIAITDNSTQRPIIATYTEIGATLTDPQLVPMGTQQAVKLLVQGIAMTQVIFPWWDINYLDSLTEAKIKATNQPTPLASDSDTTTGAKLAKMSDLLFSSAALETSAAGVPLFLTETKQLMYNLFAKAANVSASEVHVNFTHIANVAKGLKIDSFTIDIPLRKNHFSRERYYDADAGHYTYRYNTSASADGNYYYDLDLDSDCSRDACLMSKPEYLVGTDNTIVIEPQVHALAACLNENGNEDSTLRFQYANETFNQGTLRVRSAFSCPSNSKNSMYTVSVGKRIQGDDMSTRELLAREFDNPRVLRLKNARKVYSITVSLVSWEFQDLTKTYNAQCQESNDVTACSGLWLELPMRNPQTQKLQHLLVSAKRLPLALLSSYQPTAGSSLMEIIESTRLTPLVSKLVRQSSVIAFAPASEVTSDMVYPRRFTTSNWPAASDENTTSCSAVAEDFLQYAESNHLYMEQSIQPSYDAALFFLFQDAVAIDIVSPEEMASTSDSNKDASKTTQIVLEFIGNIQYIDINLSSPWLNIIQTLVGVGLLLLSSIAIAISGGKSKELEVQKQMTAHSVAELLINDSKYPPKMLAKSVAPSYFADAEEGLADQVPPQHPQQGAGLAKRRDNLTEFVVQAVALAAKETGQQIEFADFGKRDPSSGTVFA